MGIYKNVHVYSFFDCCREPMSDLMRGHDAKPSSAPADVNLKGTVHYLHACLDLKKTSNSTKTGVSPKTQAFDKYLRAEKPYPGNIANEPFVIEYGMDP